MLIHGRRASQDEESVFAHYWVFSLSPSFLDTVPLAMVKLLKKLLRQRIFEKGIEQVGPSVKISNVSLVLVDNLPIQKTDSQYSTTCSGYENGIVQYYCTSL